MAALRASPRPSSERPSLALGSGSSAGSAAVAPKAATRLPSGRRSSKEVVRTSSGEKPRPDRPI
eukprot:5942752-Prymnesium_polylepis.1